MQAAEGQPLLEGPIADRWRTLSEEVQRARHAGLASAANEMLLAQAEQEADGELGAALLHWAADSLVADARFEEAVGLYREAGDREPGPAAELDVRAAALGGTAEAFEALGDADAAIEAYERVAGSDLPGTSPARAWFHAGRVAAEARRDDDARKAFSRAADAKDPVHADLARRAVERLDAGAAAARPQPEDLARELTAALRRRDGDALRGLASATHFAVGLGGHFQFVDSAEMLDRVAQDLGGSDVHADPRALKGCGGRRHLETRGWAGEWFSGRVSLTLERTRDGWEWTGITPLAPTEAWVGHLEPDERGTNQPIGIPIKAPWPSGIRMRAGGLVPYIGEQASIVLASFIPFAGPAIAATMTLGLAARDCGFGPGVLYYNMATTHLPSVEQSAFAIDFVRYLQFVPYANFTGATPALSIAPGVVTLARAGFASGDSSSDNRVEIRHVTVGGFLTKGGFRTILINTPFLSKYLHLAGPNLVPVSVGMFVRQGARLGPMDDTGNSAYDHLHFSVHDDALGGASVRPTPMDGQTLLDFEDGKCILSSNVPFP